MADVAEVTILVRRGTQEKLLSGSMSIGELGFATDSKAVFAYDGVAKHLVGKAVVDDLIHRPSSGVSGRFFYATDTEQLFLDVVVSWVEIKTKVTIPKAPLFMLMGA